MSHAPKRADRLLIRPASGRQAGTGLFARTNHWKDTRQTRGHPYAESQTKSTGTTLTTAPDGTATDSQSLRLTNRFWTQLPLLKRSFRRPRYSRSMNSESPTAL